VVPKNHKANRHTKKVFRRTDTKLAVASALTEPEISKKLNEIVDAVRTKAVALAERTHRTLSKLDANLAIELTPEFKADPKWAGLFSLALNCEHGIPVNKRGSGVRRLILVSFFRSEAERRLADGLSRSIIYAIEEPETAQHPYYQQILLESFQQLAAEPNCQVILSTHSPGFASYLPVDSFRFVHREPNGHRTVQEGNESVLRQIVEALGVVPDNRVKVLLCVEGPTDVDALKCLSSSLNSSNPDLPNLANDPRIAFVVLGGGNLINWVNHYYLRGLNRPEVHIYDGDVKNYEDVIHQVNQRMDGSWGVLTKKREIENYLHSDAILEGIGCTVTFGDRDNVPALIRAQNGWNESTIKKKLASCAFPKMTAARVAACDRNNEITYWLTRLAKMLQ